MPGVQVAVHVGGTETGAVKERERGGGDWYGRSHF